MLSVILMMEIIAQIKRMVGVYLNGKVVINIRDSIRKMRDMVMEKCIGSMEVFIKDNGFMVYKMEQV